MSVFMDAIAGVGETPGAAPVSRPVDLMARRFTAARETLAACLHEGHPTLARLKARGTVIAFPTSLVTAAPKRWHDPAREPAASTEPVPPFPIIQTSLTDPDGFLIQTSIGVDDFEPHRANPGSLAERAGQILGEGIAIHARGLGQLIGRLEGNAARKAGRPPARIAYDDIITNNPHGLRLQAADVRDPRFFWAYIQIQTLYQTQPAAPTG